MGSAYEPIEGMANTPNLYLSVAVNDVAPAAVLFRRSDFDAEEHEHAEAQISVFLRGNNALFLHESSTGKNVSTPVRPGSAMFIASGQRHRTHWCGSGELVNFYFTDAYIRSVADSRCDLLQLERAGYRADQCMASLGQMLVDEYNWTGSVAQETADYARFLAARRLLFSARVVELPRRKGLLSLERLKPAIDRLSEQPERAATLGELAGLCHSSTFHFAHSFKDRLGCAPFEFQRSARVSKAAQLLANADLSIERIAFKVGVDSAASFTRMFRRKTGLTPSEFRRKLLAPV